MHLRSPVSPRTAARRSRREGRHLRPHSTTRRHMRRQQRTGVRWTSAPPSPPAGAAPAAARSSLHHTPCGLPRRSDTAAASVPSPHPLCSLPASACTRTTRRGRSGAAAALAASARLVPRLRSSGHRPPLSLLLGPVRLDVRTGPYQRHRRCQQSHSTPSSSARASSRHAQRALRRVVTGRRCATGRAAQHEVRREAAVPPPPLSLLLPLLGTVTRPRSARSVRRRACRSRAPPGSRTPLCSRAAASPSAAAPTLPPFSSPRLLVMFHAIHRRHTRDTRPSRCTPVSRHQNPIQTHTHTRTQPRERCSGAAAAYRAPHSCRAQRRAVAPA